MTARAGPYVYNECCVKTSKTLLVRIVTRENRAFTEMGQRLRHLVFWSVCSYSRHISLIVVVARTFRMNVL